MLCNDETPQYWLLWEEGRLQRTWREAVVPTRKPGKDPSKPSDYRPIALASIVCKIMKRVITERLTYFIERRGMFVQSEWV